MTIRSHPPRGMILFFVLIILGVTATAVILLLSQSSLNGLTSANEKIQSVQARSEVFGCLDEVLIQFTGDANYSPTSVGMGAYTCTASVQSNGTVRTVTLTRTNQNITRRVIATLDVSTSPFTVSSILEQ